MQGKEKERSKKFQSKCQGNDTDAMKKHLQELQHAYLGLFCSVLPVDIQLCLSPPKIIRICMLYN